MKPWRVVLLGAVLAIAGPAPGARAAEHEPAAGETRFDLGSLVDGESRSFGSAEHAVKAVRRGSSVTIEIPAGPERAPKQLVCTVGKDTCYVFTTLGQERVKLFVGEMSPEGEKRSVIVLGSADGADELDDEAFHWVGNGESLSFTTAGAGSRQVTLRCPEGDTTMRVANEEAESAFSCPKHGKLLEKLEGERRVRKIIVKEREESK